ncbi:LysR family transcriptional regulator [Acinetobacter rudis]|uniref:LysR family transcriptional regulator n=1 Tax=Acinetobacter rudis TaxID=632955 RepID=A0AAW8J880_9GAMM|nr:LysR family transcriptional regulator [Acinetobacter rudis]MDQ8935298.1 LysR family transcriptional regulator [Acinetobacter rudis]MDQ9017507.1 LysR family transcriptional regulator [Acinetobacter rudis]
MLTFKQCTYLITIVEEGSFISASEKLFIAQSALSRQIKNLEDELGFIIFDRSEKRIKLTTAGSFLYKNIKRNLENFKHSIELAKGMSRGENRTLNISHSSSILLDQRKLQVFDQLCQSYDINIELNTLSSELQIEAILRGDMDLGFIRPPVYHTLDEVNVIDLYTEPLYVAVSSLDPQFDGKSSVSLSDLKASNFVSTPHAERGGLSYLVSNLCLSHGFSQKKARISSRKLSQLDLVAQGFGVCIVPEEFSTVLPKNVKLLRIIDHNSLSEVKLVWKKDHDLVVEQCAESIQNFYKLDNF